LVPVLTSPFPRVPTIYREQYCSVQRNDPPRMTRFGSRGSSGSNDEGGPVGFGTTPRAASSA